MSVVIPAPEWSVEQYPHEVMEGGIVHRGKKHIYGGSEVYLERLDHPMGSHDPAECAGLVEVVISTVTEIGADPDEIRVPLHAAGEIYTLLDGLLKTITAVDFGKEVLRWIDWNTVKSPNN